MPNEKITSDFKVGQTVYLVSRHRKERNRQAKIKKIGRKYITIGSLRFTLDGIGYDSIYTPEFTLWVSESAYELALEERRYRNSIPSAVDSLKYKLTLDQLNRIEKIINEPKL